MLVRYFAAARAATGVDEETVDLPETATVAGLASALADRHPVSASDHTPPLAELLTRCSFLRNEVAVRDLSTALDASDVVDVLPPFAGG